MLRFFIGRAGTGKTAAVIAEIKQNMSLPTGRDLLLVPEQYSHEAERELCRACGDRLSLTAEVLSFTGLQRSMAARVGGAALPWLDKGGRMLCMALALQGVGSRLKVYSAAQYRPELQGMLLSAVDEFKSACIDSAMLQEAAVGCEGALAEKLTDLSLVLEAYDSVVANGRADPSDRLTLLARQIDAGGLPRGTRVYVDGFIDFTRQEQELLFAMLRQGLELTVCLTLDSLSGENEVYALSRHAARSLSDYARELGQQVQTVRYEGGRSDALSFFAEHMFSYSEARWEGPAPLRLYRAESLTAECEQAAALCLELARDRGCRWRDISIVIRGYEDYRPVLESVFRHYGVPLYTAARSDLMQKPLPALIAAAYEIIQNGWALDDVMSYLRTGLAGLDEGECDELERYLFKWQLRGSAWERRGDWRQHPEGYGAEFTEATEQRLAQINALRRRVAGPLLAFARAVEAADTARGQAAALSLLFSELRLPETLERRSEELVSLGRERSAAEYRQLWELTVGALEQCAAILGDSPMDGESFGRLFTLMLSRYDVGTIPVSLDRVSAGDFDRNRRRDVKHLLVLGASDARLPRAEEGGGVFSPDERQRLLELDIDLGAGGDSELWREFSLIYHTLSLPSESLTLLCPLIDADGAAVRPASVCRRAQALFSLPEAHVDLTDVRMSAPAPALALAAEAIRGAGGREQAARTYFAETAPARLQTLEQAAHAQRGSLSRAGVERLYGSRLRLSPSRIEKFASCRFAYFCQYGLRARPYEPAGFQPPEMGVFLHCILENTAREVSARGGFRHVTDEELAALADTYIERYIHDELNDFQEKSRRFVYLFRRLRADVQRIVADMAEELRRSDFQPLDFELNFAEATDVQPLELGGDGERLALTGVADRVDGWMHDGKLYLRVVDYKTGRKEFSLSDVWYGRSLQMLLYLFTLSDGADGRYGAELQPAGVMYIPARSPMLSTSGPEDEASLDQARSKELRRSGLVLDDPALLDAWEQGAEKRYIPVKFKGGAPTPEALANAERLGLLSRHIKKELGGMARQLRAGSIAADPWYRSNADNACLNCDYLSACAFRDGQNGEHSRYLAKLSPDEVWAKMEEADSHA